MNTKPNLVLEIYSHELKFHKMKSLTFTSILTVFVIILGILLKYYSISIALEFILINLVVTSFLYVMYSYLRSEMKDRVGEKEELTSASLLTIFRGLLVVISISLAVSVGIYGPGPTTWLAGLTFGIAGLLDLVDGYLARSHSKVTEFGARLDLETDAMATLAGSMIIVAYGLVSPLFILVGLSRYIYMSASWILHDDSSPSDESNFQWLNQLLFVFVFVSMWISMLPITKPSQTKILLPLVGIPFLLNFARSFVAANRS